jgi:acyl-CoA synthetase (AMP-forming)/AMP-acid ligase II
MDIARELESRAVRSPDKPAFLFKDNPITFGQLYEQTARLANAFSRLGVGPGDSVGLYLPNTLDYARSFLACLAMGAVAVPIHYGSSRSEIAAYLNHTDAKLLLTSRVASLDSEALKGEVASLTHIIHAEEELDALMAEASARPSSFRSPSESDPAIVFYTTGTTGSPKGVLWRARHLDNAPRIMKYFLGLGEEDATICAVPLSHSGGLVYLQNCVGCGVTTVLQSAFSPPHFIRAVRAYGVTGFHIVPAMMEAIMRLPRLDTICLPSVRWAAVFGAPSSPDLIARFNQLCPHAKLFSGYGLTETAPPTTLHPLDRIKPASVGMAPPWYEMAILDDQDRTLPPGRIGEIAFKGGIVAEYYRDPALTQSVMGHGWFHTGDLGECDEEGYLYIRGRKKEVIIVGGLNVYTDEVEFVLSRHPAVREAAVVGIPHAQRGEQVKAVVVLNDGQTATAKELIAYCREHLVNYKVPRVIEFRDALPRVGVGKVDKTQLK